MSTDLPITFPSNQVRSARRALLGWFARSARPLPWRNSPTPYEVWVSEVMLQQTQVSTVVPYFERFIGAFPTLSRLARAPLEKVLEIWSGMGYYRRARHLHRAAQTALRNFRGRFPESYRAARSLPGVGDYTARAVLSIAYNQPWTVMDGNVERVMARWLATKESRAQPEFRLRVEGQLNRLLSRRQPGTFNQALMELGQTVCLPRAPRCTECPLRRTCAGYRQSRPEAFPAPKLRRSAEVHHLAAAIVRRRGRIALVRGLDDGLLPDLWNFPSAFGRSRAQATRNLREKLASLTGGPLPWRRVSGEVRHRITFRSIRVHLFEAEAAGKNSSMHWFAVGRLEGAAISQLARKIAHQIDQG